MNIFGSTYKPQTDEELMSRIVRGDKRAFDVLYTRFSPALMRYFHRMLWRDKEKAEDFVQDFFMKIIRQPESFDGQRKFSTWMYSVAHNMCKNEYRRMEIRKPVEFESVTNHVTDEHGDNFGKRIDRKAFMNSLGVELEKLDENHRTVFVLRFEENLSIREIGDIMDISEGTVKSRIFYTLRKLSGKLSDYAPNEIIEQR
ncbi:MAG: RNA polymerase sigma factor [Bacteroidetes bacterium]|nr:RNA polymerase sigma factor [Bacteroidota bacterium]